MSIILDGTAGITTTGLLTGTNATIGNVSSSEIDVLSTLGNVTPSRVIISNAAGKFVNSPTTLTEVGYLNGVTSAVQTQLNGKEPTIAAGNTAQYWRGDKTWQTLPTPDLSAYAPKASPTFTGNPTAPTPPVGDNDTSIATTAFVDAIIGNYKAQDAHGAGFTLAQTDSGKLIIMTATATVTLPAINTIRSGSLFIILCAVGITTIALNGNSTDAQSLVLTVGNSIILQSDGGLYYRSVLDARGNLNASGAAPIYACRAWVNFNGTGTVAIRASGNVTSITDRGTGLYSANFTTAMADANYACVQSSGDNNILAVTAQYASYVEIKNTHPNEMIVDTGYGNVSIYR